MRAHIVSWLGIGLSIGLLYYLGQVFDVGQVWEALSVANPLWLALAALVYVALFPLRGLRWSVLFREVKPISPTIATEVFLVGFMANNIMPARLGDVARAFVLGRKENISVTTTFSNIMLERVFDGITVVGFLFAVLVLDPPEAVWVETAGALMGLVFFGALSFAGVVAWNEQRALAIAEWFLRPFPEGLSDKVHTLIAKLAAGFKPLRNPKVVLSVTALSLAIWGVEVVVYAVAQRAFGLSIPPLGLCLIMAVLTLGITAPSAPGFLGVYETLIVKSVGLYGVTGPLAPAFAVAMHLIHYVPGTVLGFVSTWRLGLKVRELKQGAEHVTDDEDPAPLPAEASRRAPSRA